VLKNVGAEHGVEAAILEVRSGGVGLDMYMPPVVGVQRNGVKRCRARQGGVDARFGRDVQTVRA
jgi:hypothetical protein